MENSHKSIKSICIGKGGAGHQYFKRQDMEMGVIRDKIAYYD